MQTPLVVVLAGGEGKRFKPLVTNKTMFPFLGQPLIYHTIQTIQKAGLTDVVVVGNKENQLYCTSTNFKSMNVSFVLQNKPLGMADAVLRVEKAVGDRPMLVIDAAKVFEPKLITQILENIEHSSDVSAVVAARKVDHYFPGGYLLIEKNRAKGIIEKPKPGTEPSNFVTIVCHYYKEPRKFFELLHDSQNAATDDRYEQALNLLMKDDHVTFSVYEGSWISLKHSYHVLDLMRELLHKKMKNGIAKSAHVSPKASITGDVCIEEGATIDPFAVVVGPAYIGKNVFVRNNTLIRESMIEEGTVVGFGTEIARSYVGPKCKLHQNFVGDTVLEAEVNPSWGTCFANRRIDNTSVMLKTATGKVETGKRKLGAIVGKGAFFGIHCSVMPGVAIESNSKILPSTTVNDFVSSKTP